MKKFLLTAVVFSGAVLLAGTDLNVKHFSTPENGLSRIVSRGGWFGRKAIMLDGKAGTVSGVATTAASSMYRKVFPFRQAVYEVSADILVRGTAYIDLLFIDASGKTVLTRRVISATAPGSGSRREYEGKADMRGILLENPPVAVRLVIGIKENSSAVFDDIELEIDND